MTNEEYWGNIRSTLNRFCVPTDQLHCNTVTVGPEVVCRMCGYSGITYNYILENPRTREKLVVGSNCILNYRLVMEEMQQPWQPVIFSSKDVKKAEEINAKRPGTVVVQEQPADEAYEEMDREDRERLGLDPTEEDEEEDEEERLIEMGLDPEDPNYEDLAPHGMETGGGDDDDDEDDDGDGIEGIADDYDDYDDDDMDDDDMDDDDMDDD